MAGGGVTYRIPCGVKTSRRRLTLHATFFAAPCGVLQSRRSKNAAYGVSRKNMKNWDLVVFAVVVPQRAIAVVVAVVAIAAI